MITYNDFLKDVIGHASKRPGCVRFGQSVFDYIDQYYGVAREVQFQRGVDCFYRDDIVEDFIRECYDVMIEQAEKENIKDN